MMQHLYAMPHLTCSCSPPCCARRCRCRRRSVCRVLTASTVEPNPDWSLPCCRRWVDRRQPCGTVTLAMAMASSCQRHAALKCASMQLHDCAVPFK
eukprot:174245-Chlamydomonas_euryale.AAC.1